MNITGRNFALRMKINELANGVKVETPYFLLTKTECLYIATKFNDEARAKLVLRAGRGDGDTGKRDRLAGLLRDAPRLGAAEGVGPTPSHAGGEQKRMYLFGHILLLFCYRLVELEGIEPSSARGNHTLSTRLSWTSFSCCDKTQATNHSLIP